MAEFFRKYIKKEYLNSMYMYKIIIGIELNTRQTSLIVLMNHLRKLDFKKLKEMIGILYGVKNNISIKYSKRDYNHIKELITLEIISNYVEKTS